MIPSKLHQQMLLGSHQYIDMVLFWIYLVAVGRQVSKTKFSQSQWATHREHVTLAPHANCDLYLFGLQSFVSQYLHDLGSNVSNVPVGEAMRVTHCHDLHVPYVNFTRFTNYVAQPIIGNAAI